MTGPDPASIGRREALRRVAVLLGGALSAPAIAGVLAGCRGGDRATTASWTPRALSTEQGELVAAVADHIIPRTDTPGARDVGVHRFIDVMMAEYYSSEDRERFLAGLADLDARAQRTCRESFLRCSGAQQRELLTAVDAESFAPRRAGEPIPWFRTMKELTLLGYYTSEAGASDELRHVAVPGRFDPCVPVTEATRTWAV